MVAARAPAGPGRRAALKQGAIGLAAAFTLAGCATSDDEAPEQPALQPPIAQAFDDLGRLRDGADPVVAGEVLDGSLLRRFYARHDFEPVWASRPAEAAALTDAILDAADHGLDPELFHANLLRRAGTFPPLRRELLLSHAVLTYAEALAFGAVPVSQRRGSEDLAPEPLDVTAVLDAGLERAAPLAAIEALAPRTPGYQALRQTLQRYRAGGPSDPGTTNILRMIEVNLERQRWLPRRLPSDRVWVNVADQRLVFYRDGRPVFTTRVAVGEEIERKQSPEFRTRIEGAFLNPPWVIPRDIVQADVLPRLERDPEYLKRNNIVLKANGEAEQAPGPNAGLGVIMFDMPNRFDVYLHDTPNKAAFENDNRRVSNGCIRVQNPLELAALLMDEPLEAMQGRIATGGSRRKSLPKPVPVFILYQTVFESAEGRIEIRPDFYGRDGAVWRRLQKRPQAWEAPGAFPAVQARSRVAPSLSAPRRAVQPASVRPLEPWRR